MKMMINDDILQFLSSVYKIKEIHSAQLEADGDAPVVGTAHIRTLHTHTERNQLLF
jgi:hypothetical protein